jgi:SAM-dependent methyltransferase
VPSDDVVDDQGLDEVAAVWGLTDLSLPVAVRLVASLGLPDLLRGGPQDAAGLAAASGVPAAGLHRLLRAVATTGALAVDAEGRFRLGPVAEVLTRDHPLSMRDAYTYCPMELEAWGAFDHSVRTGESAFARVHGVHHRDYRALDIEEDERMHRAHFAATRVDLLTLLRTYPWGSIGTVVDVGGGSGAFLAGLLRRHPAMRGVLLDLPHVVPSACAVLAEAGVADRCEVVGGDYFAEVPPGADAYVLKTVLGGWDDGPAVEILSTIRRAMRPDSRLLVINPVLGFGDEFQLGAVVNLGALALYGGPDRSPQDYERLLRAAGFELVQIIARSTLPIIEAVLPAASLAGSAAGAR